MNVQQMELQFLHSGLGFASLFEPELGQAFGKAIDDRNGERRARI
jgi:hypothetical protein